MESMFLENYPFVLPFQEIHRNIETEDAYANKLLRTHEVLDETWIALQTTGDGNCLFNAVSIEIFKMEANMNDQLAQSLYFVSPEYKDACLNCATPGEFSSSWTILALSHIIHAPIVSYYPPCNGRGDKVFDILNTTFGKVEKGNKVHLLWPRVLSSSSKTWLPNHFVPLCKNATKIMNSTPNNSYLKLF